MPRQAADNPRLIVDLLRVGMDIMRINCAHDGPVEWQRMVANLRLAERSVGRTCRVQADLAGPKLRTGSLQPVGRLLRIKPRCDALGRLVEPARIWLTPPDDPETAPAGATTVPVVAAHGAWRRGRVLTMRDLRGRNRLFRVLDTSDRSLLAEVERTARIGELAQLDVADAEGSVGHFTAGKLPALVLPAMIHCTLDAAIEHVRPGQRVWIDDGEIGGFVRRHRGATIEIDITHAPPGGAMTEKDLADLREVVGYVDIVALSFLRTEQDVLERMSEHHDKRMALLRRLSVSEL